MDEVVPVPSDVLACYYGQRGMEKQEDFEFNHSFKLKWLDLNQMNILSL